MPGMIVTNLSKVLTKSVKLTSIQLITDLVMFVMPTCLMLQRGERDSADSHGRSVRVAEGNPYRNEANQRSTCWRAV